MKFLKSPRYNKEIACLITNRYYWIDKTGKLTYSTMYFTIQKEVPIKYVMLHHPNLIALLKKEGHIK